MIKGATLLLFYTLLSPVGVSAADNAQLQAMPKKCVTLKQGNTCYQDVKVHWQVENPGNYCLTLSSQELPLQCWTNISEAVYKFEFSAKNRVLMELVNQDSGQSMGQQTIDVKWVYRNRSRNLSWRVF